MHDGRQEKVEKGEELAWILTEWSRNRGNYRRWSHFDEWRQFVFGRVGRAARRLLCMGLVREGALWRGERQRWVTELRGFVLAPGIELGEAATVVAVALGCELREATVG